MTDKSPLLVPVPLYALVVNNQPQNFRRWSMNYGVLADFLSPEAQPFSGNQNDFKYDSNRQPNTANQGVYLQWALPEALRHGTQNEQGAITFPLVPNRWLVVRYLSSATYALSRSATAWVIESDFIHPTEGTCPFIDPTAPVNSNPQTYAPVYSKTLIGRQIALQNQSWQEPHNALFLQAVAPANTMFASYQPHIQNVFSFHDNLATQVIEAATLSYLVVGWYSNSTADPLANWQSSGDSYADALAALQWTAASDDTATAQTTLYQGMVMGVNWNQNGPLPTSARDDAQPTVAIGNTSIDAFTAWLEVSLPTLQQQYPDADFQWLEALQYNLLNEYNQPDGAVVLDQRIHEAWFGALPGGTQWQLVNQTMAIDQATPPPLTAAEKSWLDTLNQNQQTLDQMRWQLYALQQRLYEMWWKNGFAAGYATIFEVFPYNFSQADFANQLDPANAESLTSQVYTLMQSIAPLEALVPNPTEGQTMDDAIAAFTQTAIANGDISDQRQLQALAKPRFWQASDPVILIGGVNHQLNIDPYLSLPCRYADQLVTAVEINYGSTTTLTAYQAQSYMPEPKNISSVAAVINSLLADAATVLDGNLLQALLTEFFLLAPSNAGIMTSILHVPSSDAATIATNLSQLKQRYDDQLEQNQAQTLVTGVLPAFYEPTWSQPWLPRFIEWEAYWYRLPFQTDGNPNWTFDGRDYAWTQTPGPLPEPQVITGRSILTPKTSFDMKSRVQQYGENNPGDLSLAELEAAIESINGWDFLSQTLTGFSVQVALRDPVSNVAPDSTQSLYSGTVAGQTINVTMADLVGDAHHTVPQSLTIKPPPDDELPVSQFEGMRNGQFFFRRVTLVDQFGQTIEVVTSTSSDALYPILAPGVIPNPPITSVEPDRFVQLPPRLLQTARLNFTYVLPTDDTQAVFLNSNVNPICGWILPNHLEGGLAVYEPSGGSLGELRPVTDQHGNKTIAWQPAPNALYQTIAAVTSAYSHLGECLATLAAQSLDEFLKFMAVIDETLWTVDPLGERYDQNLSVLVGRPLALVRARLQFELQQDPIWDTSWPYTFAPPSPPFVAYDFPVRLGDQDHFKDGLLGYFAGSSYEVFYAVHDPDPNSGPFIQKIQPASYINLKFDGATSACLTMLVDPRANVYAQTSILPAESVTLDQRYVQAALELMEITFRLGPQLTTISTAVTDVEAESIPVVLMPVPAERKDQWRWQERQWSEAQGNTWTEMPLATASPGANFSSVAPTLREGLLTLRNALAAEQSVNEGENDNE